MPLEGNHAGDTGLETADGPVCIHDSAEGKIKAPEIIFEGGVQFFTQAATNGDRDLALRLTRKNMKALPYWQAHPFAGLDGEQATDAEFQAALSAL